MPKQHRDEVDRIQDAWVALHPGLDVSSIGIVSRIWRVGRHLEAERTLLLDGFQSDPAAVDVLAELRRSGPPFELPAGTLKDRSKISSGGMSQRLARLEKLELIERSIDPVDRRVVNVRLTPSGIELIDAIVQQITAEEAAVLSKLADIDRAQLEDLLRKLLAIFE
jgi:DNA-binding MarR family transcriptional regulator